MFLLSAFVAAAACPEQPVLVDADATVTVLSQNLQFIAVGPRRAERAALLDRWLLGAGADVDLLLLSEAREPGRLEAELEDFCFYAQRGAGSAYHWAPQSARSPGGLVLGVRQRDEGVVRDIGAAAGRAFRSRPVTLAEGWLGKIARFVKGWAAVDVSGASLRWTHTQASYARKPERGAGRVSPARGIGRAGQFAELAESIPDTEPVLLTGDLNLLESFHPTDPAVEARVARARGIDTQTVARFFERTGMALFGGAHCPQGSFMGSVDAAEVPRSPFRGARFDRVGVNEAFRARFPATQVACAEIREGDLRVSDHLGVTIRVAE
jgi:hypothetical protein